jgi:lysophospholipase L1-like esterase
MKHTLSSWMAAPLLAAALGAAHAAPPSSDSHWQPAWMAAPQAAWDDAFVLPLGMPRALHDVTLRQWLRTSADGERLRIVASNEYGAAPLHIGRMTLRGAHGGPAVAATFQGAQGVTVPPGARFLSDPVALTTRAGERLQVDVYLPEATALAGLHWDAREHNLLLSGDAAGREGEAGAQAIATRAFVTGVLVESHRPAATVVALGDSITDGNSATPGADQRWPDHLARRLAVHGVAVLNAGISGNRLLRGGMGESALARFERDVLGQPGVRAAIVLIGTNDIGWPGGPFAPSEGAPGLAALTQGLRQLAEQGRARGVRVIGATLPPFEHALEGTPLQGHSSPAKDALRQALNRWIRESGAFDAVADFDAVLRDPARPSRLKPEFDSGDHLHPGDAGYRAMAQAIDLQALLGGALSEARR